MEMDSKTIAEISARADEKPEMITHVSTSVSADKISEESNSNKEVKATSVSTSASNQCSGSILIQGEETVTNSKGTFVVNPSFGEAEKGSKSLVHLKNPVGKKKVKVDWTPELHKKFVQAVEQLGVDKAVPSRILELMGIDCLTRHSVASHLQIIALSASTNKLSNIQKQADEYARLIMEELDPNCSCRLLP